MPRYTATFEGVAASAAQDLISIKTTSAIPLRVERYWVKATDTALPVNQQLEVRARILPATVTQGSGGTTPTPSKLGSQTDQAAQSTVHANDTSKATTSGTAVITDEGGENVYNGFDSASENRPPLTVAAGAGFVFELLSTPSGTLHLSGGVDFEEVV